MAQLKFWPRQSSSLDFDDLLSSGSDHFFTLLTVPTDYNIFVCYSQHVLCIIQRDWETCIFLFGLSNHKVENNLPM